VVENPLRRRAVKVEGRNGKVTKNVDNALRRRVDANATDAGCGCHSSQPVSC
jgi:hypothetical protein